MKKKYRLLKRKDFKYVLDNKRKIFTTNFACFWIKDKSIENIKIGIIIPKKKCKLAVNRNYLKRLFWSITDQNRKTLNLPKYKCVFFYNKIFFENFCINNFSAEKLKNEIKKIHLELIKKNNEITT